LLSEQPTPRQRGPVKGGPIARFEFDTAWAFPAPVAKALSRKFPTLRFVWTVENEGDMQFPDFRADIVEYHDGKMISCDCYNRADADGRGAQ
jgi:hypothetical protein